MGVSYLVSSYNKRPWLPAVLASVEAERERTGGEIVLIDDGSTDGSTAICAAFAAESPFVRLTLQENRGIFAVTNQLTAAARENWVRLVDSDDPLVPGSTAALLAAAQAGGYDYVFGRARPYGPAGPSSEEIAAAPAPASLSHVLQPISDPYRYAIREYNHVPSTTLFRRALLDRCDPLPEHFVSCQDLALALRLFARARVARVDAPVCWQLVGVENRLSARETLTLQQTALIIGEYGERHFSPRHKRMAAKKLLSRAWRKGTPKNGRRLLWRLTIGRASLEKASALAADAHLPEAEVFRTKPEVPVVSNHSGSTENLFFVHLPKTGGMSLRAYLADQYYPEFVLPAQMPTELRKEFLEGCPHLIMGHFPHNFDEVFRRTYKKITFIRDPVERTVSGIRHFLREPSFAKLDPALATLSLREAIYNPEILSRFANGQATLLASNPDPMALFADAESAQATYDLLLHTSADENSILERARQTLETFDFVGMADEYARSLSLLSTKYGFPFPSFMPEVNVARDVYVDGTGLSENDLEYIRRANNLDQQIYEFARHCFESAPIRPKDVREPRMMKTDFLLNLGRPFRGSGWHGPERQSNGSYARWSGPGPRSEFFIPTAREVSWRVEVVMLGDCRAVQCTVENAADLSAEFSDGTTKFRATIPALSSETRSGCTIAVHCPAVRDMKGAGGDLRNLGVFMLQVSARRA